MTESDILQEAGCVRNIPPHNPKANTPQAAYAAEAVITPAEQVASHGVFVSSLFE